MEDLYKLILDNMTEGIYTTDTDRRITYWNREAEKLTGYREIDILGGFCHDNILVHSDEHGTLLCKTACPLAATMKDGNLRLAQVYLLHKDGHRKPVAVKTAPIYDEHGKIVGAIESFTDSSMPLDALRQVEHYREAALIDSLTGVGNRRYTQEQIMVRLEALKMGARPFGLLFVDIDKFKQINDRYLHSVGDQALQLVARTLLGNLRSSDFLGRWGGDEFIVLISDVQGIELSAIARKLAALIRVSRLKLDNGASIHLSVSVGGTVADRPTDTLEGLLDQADKAMYLEKRRRAVS